MKKYIIYFCLVLFLFPLAVFAQQASRIEELDSKFLNWQNMDPKIDKIAGVSVNKAYLKFLKDKEPKKKVVVAVIDSGVDIEHEDLKGKIWVNQKEIPGNGIDDDGNGYVDDIHGWNFLGNATGENINDENFEPTRVVRRFDPVFKDVKFLEDIDQNQVDNYQMYLSCKKDFDTETIKYQTIAVKLEAFDKKLTQAENIIKNHLKKDSIIPADVFALDAKGDEALVMAKGFLELLYKQGFSREILEAEKEQNSIYTDKYYNLSFEPRKIINDNIEDINDRSYGNANVTGERADHGTLVAGLIAANRNNGIGIDGIASYVEIMVLRTVPSGDELDKDVALSIIYAVDNGADIINLSFGKDYSPEKFMVDQAIKYAQDRNVLIVHAAGNAATNIDETERYPTKRTNDNQEVKTWINVGASAKKADKNLTAVFSNYGQKNVDLFAPGVDVISLYPGNKYEMTDGTSFSSPVVAGVAALVLSFYPELTALELKEVLVNSTVSFGKKKVFLPNITSPTQTKVKFSSLSNTGGIVNAYQALILAEKMVNLKK
jgi:subtilisin family serine protease